jgi:hypothetical protein
MSEPITTEALRELARRIRQTLPDGVFYALIVWPPGKTDDLAYFSNAQRIEAREAIQTLLGHGLEH